MASNPTFAPPEPALRWRPSRDTLVAFASYLLVLGGIWLAFEYFTTARVAMNFITFGIVVLAILGVMLPVLYTTLVRQRPLADLGITRKQLFPSLALGLLMGATTWYSTIGTMDVAWSLAHVPLVMMTLAVGLFEAVFFRGWLQLTFERAFGLVPGLVLAAAAYSLYHIGYGMAPAELVQLFYYGLLFGGLFRLTSNIAVVWPLYTPVGALYSRLVENMELPFPATYGFVIVLAMMVGVVALSDPRGRKVALLLSGAGLLRKAQARWR